MALKRITTKEGEVFYVDSITGERVEPNGIIKTEHLLTIYPMPLNKWFQIFIGFATILLTYFIFTFIQFQDIESRDISFWYFVASSSLLISLLLKYFGSLSLIENCLTIICSFEVLVILRIIFDTQKEHNLFPFEIMIVFIITGLFGFLGSFLGGEIKKLKMKSTSRKN